MIYLILLLAFFTIVTIIMGIYNIVFSKRIAVTDRLDYYTREDDYYNQDNNVSLKEFILGIIVALNRLLSRKSYLDEKKRKLNQAYVFLRPEEFVGISLLVAIGFALLVFLGTRNIFIGLLGLIIGYKLPDLYISSLRKTRMKKLSDQLPEALGIISNGLRAGFSFNQALSVAAKEIDSPLKDEFSRIVRDNSIGKPMDEVLMDFSTRVDDEDVEMFVTALLIQRSVGGNLTEVLDTLAETIRDRMRIRGEINTLTAQGRLSAIIISLLPFFVAAIIFFMSRDYIMELFTNPVGIFMIGAALVLQVIGIFIITKMVNIEI